MKKEAKAIALEYGAHETPVVTASGEGNLARQIIAAAEAAGVHVHQDEDLAALLGLLDLDQTIPPYLYRLVAEVLVYTYWLRGMKPGDQKPAAEEKCAENKHPD